MMLKKMLFLVLCCLSVFPHAHSKELKATQVGEGKSKAEACYRSHGELRRLMAKKCKDDGGVNYDTLDLEDCDVKKQGKIFKATYKSKFQCKGKE